MDEAMLFWRKVDQSGGPDACWPWIGQRPMRRTGYPRCSWPPGSAHETPATHVALLLDGRPLAPGQHALHRCDNPPCVNPAHLYAGSPRENARDRVTHGHHFTPPSISTARRKLTAEQAEEIRRLRLAGGTYEGIGAQYGVNPATVRQIVLGQTYR